MLRWSVRLGGTPQRRLHCAVAVRHKVYCFGWVKYGYIEMHIFNSVSSRWMTLPPVKTGRGEHPPEVPSKRTFGTAVLIEDIVYIWGGRVAQKPGYCNVLYAFDVDTHRWSKPDVSGTVPEARSEHSACVFEKVMYVYGGYTDGRYYNDIYKLDTTTMVWSLINTRGTPPPASERHSATIIRTKMFVFGGRGARLCYNNTISVFDTETNCWLRTPSTQLHPIGRDDHSAFTHNGELYIFGGDNYPLDRTFNDLWKINPETFSWKKVEPRGKAPCSWMSAMCCCMVGDHIILFGGFRYTSIPVDAEDEVKDDLLYILDLNPSLKTLCKLAVIQNTLDQSELPHNIRWELSAMTSNSNRSKYH